MVKRAKGGRQNTRHKLSKNYREKGKVSITKHVQTFNVGDKVLIKPEPSVQTGMPFRRFFGKVGVIMGKKGKAYEIEVKDYNMKKTIISLPVHLVKR
ncbi:MAG: 50S ribosomal protein L21e [Candidatus Nanoarchaeia archaeon]|nr:50S ribosomal protein L21e [Candidatus Nanoarchaeia archaeon]